MRIHMDVSRFLASSLLVLLCGFGSACGSSEATSPADTNGRDVGTVEDSTTHDIADDAALLSDADSAAANDQSGTLDAGPTWSGVVPELSDDSLSIRLAYEGRHLVTLGSPSGTNAAFFAETGERSRAYVRAPATRSYDEGGLVLDYELEDGRAASVVLRPVEEGALQVTFRVPELATGTLADRESSGAVFTVGDDEGFYGLMERVVQGSQGDSWREGTTEGLDLRGQDVNLFVYPTVSAYSPFFVTSAGYGVYVESDWPGDYRFPKDETPNRLELVYEGPELTFRIIPGSTPLEVIERYSRTVGTSLLPPRWVFGHWRWRDDHYALPAFYDGTVWEGPFNSMVVEDILMMDALDIPCSLYWVDRPWAEGSFGYDDMDWDEDRLPEPVQMVEWLAGRGIQFMLWLAPWAHGPQMEAEAVANGYDVEGGLMAAGDSPLIDLTNPDAVAWWQDHIIPLIGDGVAGFKLDRGEEKTPDGFFISGTYDSGVSYREGRNRYPQLYAAAVQGAFERAGAEEYVVMPRSGWVGTSSHAVVWGGDTASTSWGLRSAIIAVQRSATMNFPVWGSDTCGYGGRSTHEVCARWLAFSAFCPLMEVGPTANIAFWNWAPDGESAGVGASGYRHEPFYDAELLAIWHLYANLHQDLLEYSYAQAELAHTQGTPIVRAMPVAYPDRTEYRDLYTQYLYGPDILVRPVWEEGVTEVDVHVPEGTWRDAWSGASLTGPTVVTAPADMHRIPIYVRDGSEVELGDLGARWSAAVAATAVEPDIGALAAELIVELEGE